MKNNKTAAWVGVGIGIVVAGALAFAFSAGSPANLEKPAFGDVSVQGQALPTFGDPSNDQAIGMPAPILTGGPPFAGSKRTSWAAPSSLPGA